MTCLNYYKILRVNPEATPQKINEAFSNLRILFDENKEKNAKEIMELVDEAYFALRDPQRRAVYDMDRLSLHVSQPNELSEAEKIISSWGVNYTTEEQLYIEKIHLLNRNVKFIIAIGSIIFLWAVVKFRWDIALALVFFIAFTRKILGAIYLFKNPPPPPEVWGVK
jgi:hypothetical protein